MTRYPFRRPTAGSGERDFAMIVAMRAVSMVKMPFDNVVRVTLVWKRFMSTTVTVLMALIVACTGMIRRTTVRIRSGYF